MTLHVYDVTHSLPLLHAGVEISDDCSPVSSAPLFDRGFIASPGYGVNYNRDLHCEWRLAAQRHQHLRLTIYDFELVPTSEGKCRDFLRIETLEADGVAAYDECGPQGKQTVEVEDRNALVTFETHRQSLTERGFLLFFEGTHPHFSPPASNHHHVFLRLLQLSDLVVMTSSVPVKQLTSHTHSQMASSTPTSRARKVMC